MTSDEANAVHRARQTAHLVEGCLAEYQHPEEVEYVLHQAHDALVALAGFLTTGRK